ncbi:hypothetical protein [Alicyclobacillus sp. SP_1]|uniref:hypothetical protein n=1 Tax=Alicyclobacillus sp. SP_1 TaxID=2942475 RepID=UPI0021584EDB|nr:hypothetical protein [Alicyclobacillus sp. SP_1]
MAKTAERKIEVCEVKMKEKGRFDKEIVWLEDKFKETMEFLYNLDDTEKGFYYKQNTKVCFLAQIQFQEKYILGFLKSTSFGTKPDLLDSQTLTSRINTREIHEGDEQKTHFLVRRSDGAMFLEKAQSRCVGRTDFETYIRRKTKEYRKNIGISNYFISQLINGDFFEELDKLQDLNAITIKLDRAIQSGQNKAFEAMYGEGEEIGTEVTTLGLQMKRGNVFSKARANRYIKDKVHAIKNGADITNIRIRGKQDGKSKLLDFSKVTEEIPVQVNVDEGNLVNSEHMYSILINIATTREPLSKREPLDDEEIGEDMDDDE